jgi:peptide/nickel transport system substrate-binding protein
VGFGLAGGLGIQQVVTNLTRDTLIGFASDGRPFPKMVEKWMPSEDGRELKVWLKPALKFRNGQPIDAAVVAQILRTHLADWLGPAVDDVQDVVATGDSELTFRLRRPSTFVIDALGQTLQGTTPDATTGPFYADASTPDEMQLTANPHYFAGKPNIERVIIRGYTSLRSAWADMLRNQVDLLYEVGPDTVDLLQGANAVRVFTQQRAYAYVMVFNAQRPPLDNKTVRRQLNAAINRSELINQALAGHAIPADSPVWPFHWAFSNSERRFSYQPTVLARPVHLRCLVAEASLERLALSAQQMLAAVGVDLQLEMISISDWLKRAELGDFDILFADALMGPSLLRPYQFWHSGSPNNWGHYSSPAVDEALDRVRHAANDDEYRAGVGAFQRAMIDDPPAIFLAWSQRARAVSARFEVPVEPGRDVLGTLRLWRPLADKQTSPD